MSFPRKTKRTIAVDNSNFIWMVRKKPNHNERHDSDYLIPIQHELDCSELLRDSDFVA